MRGPGYRRPSEHLNTKVFSTTTTQYFGARFYKIHRAEERSKTYRKLFESIVVVISYKSLKVVGFWWRQLKCQPILVCITEHLCVLRFLMIYCSI